MKLMIVEIFFIDFFVCEEMESHFFIYLF